MNKPFKENKSEILYNLINAALAGGLVTLGSFANGNITPNGLCVGFVAGMVVLITKFKEYWAGQQSEYTRHLFNFI